MKYLLIAYSLLLLSSYGFSQKLSRYKMHLVAWDKSRLTGRLEAITDTSISIKIRNGQYKGKVFTFSASQTRHLKIWKPGINLPFTLFGSAAFTVAAYASAENDLGEAVAIIYGVPLGAAIGLFAGDQLSTKVNRRNMHYTDFKNIRIRMSGMGNK